MNHPSHSPHEPQQGLVIRLLGPFAVWRNGAPVPPTAWGRRKTQSLLKLLLTRRGRAFHQEELIEALYPDAAPEAVLRNLLGRVSELRRALEPDLARGAQSVFVQHVAGGSYCFSDQAPCWIDTEVFREHADAGRALEGQGSWVEACDRYRQAAALYRGDYLEDELYTDWTAAPREWWRERYLDTLEALARCEEGLGHYREAAAHSAQVIQVDPYREGAYQRKMRCHYLDGQTPQAEQTYQACLQALTELGAEPAQATRALYADIRARRLAPPPRAIPDNLPRRLPRCLGREQERAEIVRLLTGQDCRLLTLVGPGGIGKSRLAIEAATDLLPSFADGAWFVSLSAARGDEALLPAIAAALPLPDRSGQDPKRQLLNFLREKRLLLLLDEAEHLLPPSGLLTEILLAAPRVRVLVTSRIRLKLEGEWTLEVDGLRVPEAGTPQPAAQFSSVQLFVQTVRRRDSRFGVTPDLEPHIIRICRLVGGFPLGIELAAAWVGILTCAEIADEIERTNDARALPQQGRQDRHTSLRATIDRSCQWLSADERAVWERLSLFRGGFRREAAQQVAGASPSLLAHLVDKSLLRSSTPGRFDMHEVLRQYAEERRKEHGTESEWELHRQHCGYFASLLQAAAEAESQGARPALSEQEADIENVRAAWQWAVGNGQISALDRALDGLAELLTLGFRYQEGVQLFGEAVDRVRAMAQAAEPGEGLTALISRLAARAGFFAYEVGDYLRARELLHEGLSMADGSDRRREQAICTRTLARVAHRTGLFQEAAERAEQSLVHSRELADQPGIIDGLLLLASISVSQGEFDRGRQLNQESLEISQRLGLETETARSLGNLAMVAALRKEYPRAMALFQEALTLFRKLGNLRGAMTVLANLGTVAYEQGKLAEAKQYYQDALRYATESDDVILIADGLVQLGGVCSDLGETEQARDYLGRALQLCLETQSIPLALEAVYCLALLHRQTGEPERAAQLLSLILHHPASEQQARDRAEQVLEELAERLSPAVLADARAHGSGLVLTAVAREAAGDRSDLAEGRG